MIGRSPGSGQGLAEAFAAGIEPADLVKIINSGPNSLSEYARPTAPQFDTESLRKLASLADRQGKTVMVHANGELPVRIALEAGCHSIEHGYFMGRDNLGLMAEKRVVWVPTLVPIQACAKQLELQNRRDELTVARRTLEHQMEQVEWARKAGVTIALGTDAGSMGVQHGEAVGEELRLLLEAGCTLPEAIRCATVNGAHLLDVDDRRGLIAKGKPAHFLAVSGPPAHLPRQISRIRAIFLDGTLLSEYTPA